MQKIIHWFKNYWYYYKWRVIIAAFALFVVLFCVIQCSVQEKFDVYITYAGQDNIKDQINDITAAIRKTYTTKEEKETKGISVRNIIWINDKLAAEYRNKDIYFDATENNSNAELLKTEAVSGNSFIYILDKQQYVRLRDSGIFEPLSAVFGENTPETAVDEYGIDFMSTNFAKYFDVFKEWKGELVLCLRSGTLAESPINKLKGSGKYQKSYDLHKQIFKDIVEFSVG